MRKKVIELESGERLLMREPTLDDVSNYITFFEGLAPVDRMFIKDEEINQDVVSKKITEMQAENFSGVIALIEDKIVGEVSISFPVMGWSNHVGDLQLVVTKEYRGKGVARALIREITLEAAKLGLHKIQVSILEKQESAGRLLKGGGFFKEGTLVNYIKDDQGKKHDLVVYGYSI
ncbi:GNAT family N-acetyltransferase [candidate division CSSED10-310 bacterium]|uniref:GNAT family N-acetyltransferase n=1 Tax=candidate division CSSED10-310 bacterium TaxID=2855610 RepID=A0ABV6YVU0_UNCC1